ncbi:MAG: ribonuclease Z [Salinivirgaceae bacterium]|nr:ribonuclease Z [Salinivirgaceae bacterium]MDD4747622.1 ribonuclease Z [Salinivirgaceae bacterium]
MRFELTILGSGSALPTSLRNTTAQVLNVLERFFLIDCGEGCQLQLRKFSFSFLKINRIFISHMHGDHYFGLFGLLSTLNLMGRQQPLYIHGPAELNGILETVLGFKSEYWKYKVHVIPLNFENPAIIFEDKKIKVTSFPLRHSTPVCGFTFEEQPRPRKIDKSSILELNLTIKEINALKEGMDIERNGEIIENRLMTIDPPSPRKYAFMTDTLKCSSAIEIIKNADILYHEATYLHEDLALARKTCHSTAIQAAQIARDANVKKLLLGHYSSRYTDITVIEDEAKTVFSNSISVLDGEIYSVDY